MPETRPMVPLAPDAVISALGRAGYGARPEDIAPVARGFPAWVEEQLAPREDQDQAVHERLEKLTLRVHYPANPKWPAVDELRPLGYLDKPIDSAWPLIEKRQEMDGAERRRPREEVMAATILRAVHSRWQLREVLVSFWHDHFNVDAWGSEEVSVALPTYDRDVIRRHCLGNFRQFLEAVATSTTMLYYLSNRTSRAGAANENYGRELFELHTLGRGAYLNDRYDRWRQVPGALKGAPEGYIDEDVYESARAFTGWTVEDGSNIDGKRKLPLTGKFTYVESWHDGYQKRVLAHEFKEFGAAMSDGRTVLDLVARHPATASFVVTKLCRRFLGENPPESVVAPAVDVWTKAVRAPDQITQVVRLILLSPEFAAARGAKVRRPLALAAAFARATGIDLTPTEGLWNELANGGQRLFGWPPPTGLPDENAYFLGANSVRHRWALVLGIAENWWGTGAFPVRANGMGTPRSMAAQFLATFEGSAQPATVEALVEGLGWLPDQALEPGNPEFGKRLARTAAVAAMSPGFQSA
jgi:uncharacterized protein (DUF1800 family)